MLTLEELKNYNDGMDREDTLYYASLRNWRRTSPDRSVWYFGDFLHGWDDTGADDCFFKSNDLEECIKAFNEAVSHAHDHQTIDLMVADLIMDSTVQYDYIKKYHFSNLD